MTRRLGSTWRRRGDIASEALSNVGLSSDLGGLDFGEGLLVLTVAIAAALILIPIFFFGVELVIVGVFLAGGLISRVALRRPWVIEARADHPVSAGRVLEWRVSGWRKSGRLIDQVASDLTAGRDPWRSDAPTLP